MMENPTPERAVMVTQATREAVADYFLSVSDDGQTFDAFRRGEEDEHPLVEAFARHRIISQPTGDEAERLTAELAEARELMRGMMPANVSLDNPNIPDSSIVPIDCEIGDLRKIKAFLEERGA